MIELDFKKSGGLIPAIAQDWKTNDVLMLAYINEESWNETLKSGKATYWSRSRNKLWKKGEESGNTQLVKEILFVPAMPVNGCCSHLRPLADAAHRRLFESHFQKLCFGCRHYLYMTDSFISWHFLCSFLPRVVC